MMAIGGEFQLLPRAPPAHVVAWQRLLRQGRLGIRFSLERAETPFTATCALSALNAHTYLNLEATTVSEACVDTRATS